MFVYVSVCVCECMVQEPRCCVSVVGRVGGNVPRDIKVTMGIKVTMVLRVLRVIEGC